MRRWQNARRLARGELVLKATNKTKTSTHKQTGGGEQARKPAGGVVVKKQKVDTKKRDQKTILDHSSSSGLRVAGGCSFLTGQLEGDCGNPMYWYLFFVKEGHESWNSLHQHNTSQQISKTNRRACG